MITTTRNQPADTATPMAPMEKPATIAGRLLPATMAQETPPPLLWHRRRADYVTGRERAAYAM